MIFQKYSLKIVAVYHLQRMQSFEILLNCNKKIFEKTSQAKWNYLNTLEMMA